MHTTIRGLAAFVIVLAGSCESASAPAIAKEQGIVPVRVVRTFGCREQRAIFNTHRFLFSPEVVADPGDGSVRLAESLLVADETGATDQQQTESLSDRVWAKKTFVLRGAGNQTQAGADDRMPDGELFVYGSAAQVRVNGHLCEPGRPLMSTGWSRINVPGARLRPGENRVVFSGGGRLLFEPGGRVGRSEKSNDGGQTWSPSTFGRGNQQAGEYLVRLRLKGHAARGWTESLAIDVWALAVEQRQSSFAGQPRSAATSRGERVAPTPLPGQILAIGGLGELAERQPSGTRLLSWLRSGSTPAPDERNWTPWMPLDKRYEPDGSAGRHRWVQLKFELFSDRLEATPRLPPSFDLSCEFQPDRPAAADLAVIPSAATTEGLAEGTSAATGRSGRDDSAADEVRISSVPFEYQGPSPRLKLLRQRFALDKVIAPGRTELEQLMLLRWWVRHQWHTAWSGGAASWMPPWDALIILESKDQPDCLTMCTHYAAVFTQCCLALGWNARHCILDHHCVSEVWVEQHRKWVMMDAGNSKERADVGLHFERDGVPLSALELHLAQRTGKTDGITVHFTPLRLAEQINHLGRPAPPSEAPRPDAIGLTELPRFPVCQLDNYRRYAIPARNNYLSSLFPGELYQGWAQYFYDGYAWVGDSPNDPQISPEYSWHLSPTRPQDIDWSLNWVRIHLADQGQRGELDVDLETLTPNLERLEISAGGAGDATWKATPPRFKWKLEQGQNVLSARSVNCFGRTGVPSRVEVRWTPMIHENNSSSSASRSSSR